MALLPQDGGNALAVAERRARTRVHPTALILVNLGNANAGIAFNLSESGLALAAAMILPEGHLPDVRIQFPESDDWIGVSGEIVWRSKTRREAGVRFGDLSDEARREIRNWVAANAPGGESSLDPEPREEEKPASLPVLESAKDAATLISAPESVQHDGSSKSSEQDICLSLETPTAEVAAPSEKQEPRLPPVPAELDGSSDSSLISLAPPTSEDRRAHPRKQIDPPAYVQMGDANGGIVFNMSEGGFALTAAMILAVGDLPEMQIRIPGSKTPLKVTGQIVWRTKSRKEAGVRFVGLAAGAVERIRTWILSGDSYGAVEDEEKLEDQPIEVGNTLLEIPLAAPARELNVLSPPPADRMAESEEKSPLLHALHAAFPPAAVQLPGPEAPPQAPKILKSLRKRSAKRAFEIRRKMVRAAAASAGVRGRRWSSLAVLVALVGFAVIFAERTLLPPNTQAQITKFLTSKEAGVKEAVQNGPPPPPVAAAPAVTVPSPTPMEPGPTEPGAMEPGPAAPETTGGDAAAYSPHERIAQPERSSKYPITKSLSRLAENILNRGKRSPGAPAPAAADTIARAAQPMAPQTSSVTPPVVSRQALKAAPAAEPAPALPKEPSAATPGERLDPALSARLPEIAAPPAGSVSVAMDPYPSIRKSVESGLKKVRKGRALQLGHLVSKTDPIYPEDAAQHGIEGTVRIHALIGPDGSVQSLQNATGPSALIPAATDAVLRWRYSATLLAGQPVETEENIAITFRLSNAGAQQN